MGITVICRLKGKTCRKLANGQDIDYLTFLTELELELDLELDLDFVILARVISKQRR